jgi:hypothetical protein
MTSVHINCNYYNSKGILYHDIFKFSLSYINKIQRKNL